MPHRCLSSRPSRHSLLSLCFCFFRFVGGAALCPPPTYITVLQKLRYAVVSPLRQVAALHKCGKVSPISLAAPLSDQTSSSRAGFGHISYTTSIPPALSGACYIYMAYPCRPVSSTSATTRTPRWGAREARPLQGPPQAFVPGGLFSRACTCPPGANTSCAGSLGPLKTRRRRRPSCPLVVALPICYVSKPAPGHSCWLGSAANAPTKEPPAPGAPAGPRDDTR